MAMRKCRAHENDFQNRIERVAISPHYTLLSPRDLPKSLGKFDSGNVVMVFQSKPAI